jgi:hypothetical protein
MLYAALVGPVGETAIHIYSAILGLQSAERTVADYIQSKATRALDSTFDDCEIHFVGSRLSLSFV